MLKITEEHIAELLHVKYSGYKIQKARVKGGEFSDSDCYGIILAEGSTGWATWQFHIDEEDGLCIYWGHYIDSYEAAFADYEERH